MEVTFLRKFSINLHHPEEYNLNCSSRTWMKGNLPLMGKFTVLNYQWQMTSGKWKLLHYSQGKVNYCPLNKRLGDPKSWSEICD